MKDNIGNTIPTYYLVVRFHPTHLHDNIFVNLLYRDARQNRTKDYYLQYSHHQAQRDGHNALWYGNILNQISLALFSNEDRSGSIAIDERHSPPWSYAEN